MKVYTIEVNANFVTEALQARYDEVKELWACEASSSLWDQALDIVAECGLGEHVTSPSIFVDNYLVNGEFVSREDLRDCESRGIIITCDDENGDFVSDEDWDHFCENNAMLFNDQFACLKF